MGPPDAPHVAAAAPTAVWSLILVAVTGVAAWIAPGTWTGRTHDGATLGLLVTAALHMAATRNGTPNAVRSGGSALFVLAGTGALGLQDTAAGQLLHVTAALVLVAVTVYLHVARRAEGRILGGAVHAATAAVLAIPGMWLGSLVWVPLALAGGLGVHAVVRPWTMRRGLLVATLAYCVMLIPMLGSAAWMWWIWIPVWSAFTVPVVLAWRKGMSPDRVLTPWVAGVAFTIVALLSSHLEVRAFSDQGGVFTALSVGMLGSVALFLMSYDRSKRPPAQID